MLIFNGLNSTQILNPQQKEFLSMLDYDKLEELKHLYILVLGGDKGIYNLI